jgi:hypothetical protein
MPRPRRVEADHCSAGAAAALGAAGPLGLLMIIFTVTRMTRITRRPGPGPDRAPGRRAGQAA